MNKEKKCRHLLLNDKLSYHCDVFIPGVGGDGCSSGDDAVGGGGGGGYYGGGGGYDHS